MSERYPCMTYVCGVCGRGNCKLYREYNTFLSYQTLHCRECAMKRAERDKYPGFRPEHPHEIGTLVAACPDMLPDEKGELPDGATYWGYCSTPQDKVD